MLKDLLDPNRTIRHIPYKVLKAQYKREQAWSDMFVRVLAWLSLAGMLILGYVLFVSSKAGL